MLLADLDLPMLELARPGMVGDRLDATLADARATSWLARNNAGVSVLEREAAEFSLNSPALEFAFVHPTLGRSVAPDDARTAQVLADWLAGDPTGSGDPDVMIIGDLNSYDQEDPIDVLRAAGYTDLLDAFGGPLAYTYVFDSQLGHLDYAMSNPSLTSQVTGTTAWNINADEPDILDYDTSFKGPNQDAIYAPDPYRSSDHDPVIVGLDLDAPPVCVAAEPSVAGVWPPNHKMVDVEILGVTDPDGDAVTVMIDSITQDEAVDGSGSGSTAPDGAGVGTSIAQVRAERSGGGDGRIYEIGFTATDPGGNQCSGSVVVGVPKSRSGAPAVDSGDRYDSTSIG